MSNYTKTTNFAAKDSLPSGNANKIVKGTEIDTEFDNIATASATKADIAGPTFTGTVTIPTVDLNGGAIDGTTVGASTAAAITGTTIVANTSINIAGDGATVTGIKDEDDMSSNSATKLATQQSIKAYVDSQVTAQDLDFQADSGGALSIDLDSETLTFTGGTGVDTSGSGNAVTFAIDSTVATLTGTQTLTNKTLTSPTLNTPTIGTSFTIGSATITEAELEILDGATVTTAELNILDGVTATTAEINYVDGVTSNVQTQLDAKAPIASPTFTGTVTVPGLTTSADILFGDNDKAIFGAGSDLQIYHDGSNSLIQDAGTGDLIVKSNGTATVIKTNAGNNLLSARDAGSVGIFHDGSEKLTSTSTGIDVTGSVSADGGTFAGATSIEYQNPLFTIKDTVAGGSGGIQFKQSTDAEVGRIATTDADLMRFYTGSTVTERMEINSTGIDVTGTVTADGLTVEGASAGTVTAATFTNTTSADGTRVQAVLQSVSSACNVNLVSERVGANFGADFIVETSDTVDGTDRQRLRIAETGNISFYEDTGTTAKLTWSATNEDLNFADNVKAIFGAGSDLQIYHDGSASYIDDAGTGNLRIRANSSLSIQKYTGETMGVFTADGSVLLAHDNATKFETTSTGIDVTGTVTTDGLTVDNNSTTGAVKIQSGDTNTFGGGRAQIAFGYNATDDYQHFIRTAHDVTAAGNKLELLLSDGTQNNTITSGSNRVISFAGNGDISFYEDTGTTPKLFWDASAESLGIGTSSASSQLHISGSGSQALQITSSDSGGSNLVFTASGTAGDINMANGLPLTFKTASTERMRIDSSGNVLVGQSSTTTPGIGNTTLGTAILAGGLVAFSRAGGAANATLYVNKNPDDGPLVRFSKNGTAVGSIGVENSDRLYIDSGSGNTGIRFDGGAWIPRDNGAVVDDVVDLGASSARFDDIYATNGTIQTSDRNEKQDIEALSDAEQRVAVAAKGLLRKFRWKDSVAEKGDEARIHFGIIAQDLQAAFEAEGLDAGRYGMFINTTWTDEETGEERSRMGVRYSELLAFVIAAI